MPTNDDRKAFTLAMNQFWHRKVSEIVADCMAAGGSAELVTESMLTVAIGHELAAKGFRRLGDDLAAIAKNFRRQADKLADDGRGPGGGYFLRP